MSDSLGLNRHLPDQNRLSVLTAMILLSFALGQLIDSQPSISEYSLFGVVIPIPFNLTTALIFLAAGLTATGMDWLLRSHPQFEHTNTIEHILLPALTSFLVGILLYNLPHGVVWWAGFGAGAVILILVLVAEYIVVDASDARYTFASAVLAALSFILFLVLITALNVVDARFLLKMLVVFPAATLVSARTMHLRLQNWGVPWAIGTGLVTVQVAAALHYWPVLPIQGALAVLGPLYAVTGLAVNLQESSHFRRSASELGIILAIFWVAAFIVQA
jgi:hypothetical protein